MKSIFLKIILRAIKLAAKIIEIIVEKGDAADELRLKDLPGWSSLKKSVRHKEAMDMFRDKYKKARG